MDIDKLVLSHERQSERMNGYGVKMKTTLVEIKAIEQIEVNEEYKVKPFIRDVVDVGSDAFIKTKGNIPFVSSTYKRKVYDPICFKFYNGNQILMIHVCKDDAFKNIPILKAFIEKCEEKLKENIRYEQKRNKKLSKKIQIYENMSLLERIKFLFKKRTN